MLDRRWIGGRHHHPGDGRHEPPIVERRRAPGGRDGVQTVRNIQTVEVVKSTAIVADGEIVEYRVEVKIGFEYEG